VSPLRESSSIAFFNQDQRSSIKIALKSPSKRRLKGVPSDVSPINTSEEMSTVGKRSLAPSFGFDPSKSKQTSKQIKKAADTKVLRKYNTQLEGKPEVRRKDAVEADIERSRRNKMHLNQKSYIN
jgi:hypothetical protein